MKKSKPKNQTAAVVTYEERAGAMNRKAMEAEIKGILKEYEAAESDVTAMKSVSIKAANRCRKVGIMLQALCQHEQISFDFWQKHCGQLEKRFDFNNAKVFIAIARKYPEPIKSIEEAAPVTQLLYMAVDLLQLPERSEAQNPVSVSAFQKFLGEITIVRKDWEKAVRQNPPETWSEALRTSFMKDTQWLVDERARIEKLNGKK